MSSQYEDIKRDISSLFENLKIPITESTRGTPFRVAKMLLEETMVGLNPEKRPKCTTFPNTSNYDEMIIIKDITVTSICEHHLQPFIGVCHIAYIPSKDLLGLSKFNRMVDYLARKPQLQERLTDEIHSEFSKILRTDNIAVIVEAEHFCVKIRGIRDQSSKTITNKISGVFVNSEVRAEFINSVRS